LPLSGTQAISGGSAVDDRSACPHPGGDPSAMQGRRMRPADLGHLPEDGGVLVGELTDVLGQSTYEIAISGPRELIARAFAEADLEYLIDPRPSDADPRARLHELWLRRTPERVPTERATVAALDRPVPREATPQDSIVVSTRRTGGVGTLWWFYVAGLVLQPGVSLFFVLPPICNCFAVLDVTGGFSELALTLGGPRGRFIESSGGVYTNSVSYGTFLAPCWPWQWVTPWFQVTSLRETSVGNFWTAGVSSP
jgi:hypothetical protein